MRENMGLYRGKRADNGEWVEGAYYKQTLFYGDPCGKHYIITSTESLQYDQALDYFEVIPETVGEFTGVTDKNSKRIFEGDIVRRFVNGTELKGVVQHADGAFGARFAGGAGQFICFFENGEVIGNIHDTPEFLQNT